MVEAFTCQCCGRLIKAKKGVIAHHGYQRPHEGWQTGSCFGARYPSYEISRDRLGQLIVVLQSQLQNAIVGRDKVEKEEVGFNLYYRVHKFGHSEEVPVAVTRATFDAVRQANELMFLRHSWRSFDYVKEIELNTWNNRIKMLDSDIKECQKKYDDWKQVLKFENGEYVKVGS